MVALTIIDNVLLHAIRLVQNIRKIIYFKSQLKLRFTSLFTTQVHVLAYFKCRMYFHAMNGISFQKLNNFLTINDA